jgi:N-acyl-D-aspartate/D-glutamate deacylase
MSAALSLVLSALLAGADPAVEADVLVRGVALYDGSGAPPLVGDLALRKDRIVAVGRFTVAGKPRVIEGRGLVAAPGFIDLHTHSDRTLLKEETRANECYLLQGVTTVVTGNCGFGPADVAGYYKALVAGKVGGNVLHLVPHNSVRQQVMKNADRPPTAAELGRLVERGMRDGAWGLSTGLIYNPGTYARTDELAALARVAGRHGGLYASHIRSEGAGLLGALEEALAIGRSARVPVHISHLKASGKAAWGKAADAVARIAKARAAGQAVTADQYPYVASSTSLAAMVIPARFRAGEKEWAERLRKPEQAALIRKAIEASVAARGGGSTLRIASYKAKPAWRGKDLAAIARLEKTSPVEVVLEIEGNGGASVVSFGMREEDVRLIMRQPFVATASDGVSLVPSADTVPHPRSYGTFPRKVGRYALADKVLPVAQAIRSASGLPADILRLPRRGYLKTGYFADVVVFDPATFRDRATFEKPHQQSTGVRFDSSWEGERPQEFRDLVERIERDTPLGTAKEFPPT